MRIHHVQLAIPARGEPDGRRFHGEGMGPTEGPKPAEPAVHDPFGNRVEVVLVNALG